MRVTVIKDSVIYNGKIIENGKSFDANDLIGQSLIERGYVAIAGSVEETVDEAKVLTGHLDEAQLRGMSYADLKRLAAQMELDAKGTKEELINRITAEEVDVPEEAVVEDEISDEMPDTSMPE